ncbi:acyloxyacyl hydrolase [Sphingomonas sp.]|uniref:acyloxyacyl hydrolase n=1 Tax=Sphingomonas sp. TaxID=28214 RepID=UPI0017CC51CE|nr:acyloxyacyl hydrolase [Sphingomonas sp.]MBA3511901.1 acyloxyacyl hydrolase [Sphingomonas sp.]
MKRIAILLGGLCLSTLVAAPAHAGEIFGGLYIHDIKSPLTQSDFEGGADVQIGWRGGRIGPTPLQPYAFAALNTAGNTNYGAIGISAKFGNKLYVRPGLGLAVHTGSAGNFQRTDRIAFGSRVLFAPELGIGTQINDRLSIEASWVHMSHAQLFGRQNPGVDNVGVRVNFAF